MAQESLDQREFSFGRLGSLLKNGQTLLGVFQDELDLFARDAWKPVEEIIDRRPAFEVLEKRRHWNPRAFKEPCAADLARDALDRRTVAPIQHSGMLPRRPRRSKGIEQEWDGYVRVQFSASGAGNAETQRKNFLAARQR